MIEAWLIRPDAEADIADAFDWYEAHVHGLGSEFLLVFGCSFQFDLKKSSCHIIS